MKRTNSGFSLVELLVVVSIVSILSAVMYFNISAGSAQSRDVERKADLRTVAAALELYKNKNGRYPAGCRGATLVHNITVWSGQSGTNYACPSGNQYIVGLAPEFIPSLPTDPRLNGTDSGYVYTVNNSGSVYKMMALNTVETESVVKGDTFYRCGAEYLQSYSNSGPTWEDGPYCRRTRSSPSGTQNAANIIPNSQKPQCEADSNYGNDYAVSGGYSSDNRGNFNAPEIGYEYDTDIVRCR